LVLDNNKRKQLPDDFGNLTDTNDFTDDSRPPKSFSIVAEATQHNSVLPSQAWFEKNPLNPMHVDSSL